MIRDSWLPRDFCSWGVECIDLENHVQGQFATNSFLQISLDLEVSNHAMVLFSLVIRPVRVH